MEANEQWTFIGPRPTRARPNPPAMALAVLFAWPAMVSVPAKYPVYMIVLALGASVWFTWLGVKAKAGYSLLLVPAALLWLNPVFGADWFVAEGPKFFLPHAVLAMLFACAAYTYAATEKQ